MIYVAFSLQNNFVYSVLESFNKEDTFNDIIQSLT